MDEKYNKLSREEKYIIEAKGTERPFSGKYDDFYELGTYTCKRCDAELYRSVNKFDAHCGWPAFDKEISVSVTMPISAKIILGLTSSCLI